MLLKIYIISVIVCAILFYSVVFAVAADAKKEFTKEELKLIKKNKPPRQYAWYVYVFIFACPIFNVILILIAGFNYGELRDRTLRDFRKRCGKQTAEDILCEQLDDIVKNFKELTQNGKTNNH